MLSWFARHWRHASEAKLQLGRIHFYSIAKHIGGWRRTSAAALLADVNSNVSADPKNALEKVGFLILSYLRRETVHSPGPTAALQQ